MNIHTAIQKRKMTHGSELNMWQMKSVDERVQQMDENEKDTERTCNHNYKHTKTFVTNDRTAFVKVWACTECGKECEQRTKRIGARPLNPIIL